MPNPDLTRLTSKNLIHIIKASVGTNIFRHIYVSDIDGREFDATEDGDKSCAYHTSGVLALVGLIDKPHATVQTVLKQMGEAGWEKTDKPVVGCVVLWPAGDNLQEHTGFFLDENSYISNSSYDKQPKLHGKKLKDGREPAAYYTHPALTE